MMTASLLAAVVVLQGIEWKTDYNAALKEAAQLGKPVLVFFCASW